MKLSTRLTLAFILIVFLAVSILAVAVGWATRTSFHGYLGQVGSRRQQAWVEIFSSYYDRNGNWAGVQSLFNAPWHGGRGQGMGRGMIASERIMLADAEGVIVADSLGARLGEKVSSREREAATAIILNGEKAGSLWVTTANPPGVISQEDRFTRSVTWAIILAGLLVLIFAGLAGRFMAYRIAEPLNKLTSAVQKLAAGRWEQRLEPAGDGELKKLVTAFNEMAAELEKYEQLRRSMLADVVHELRTPLTVLRGQLESLQSGALAATPEVIISLHDEILRLSRLVHDLQELSLAEAKKLPLQRQNFDLNEVVQKVMTFFQVEAETGNITLSLDGAGEEINVNGDKDRLAQVLINLLGNAFRYTPPGGRVAVTVSEKERGGEVVVSVADSGPGIAAADLPYVFERFYRTDRSRSRSEGGSGLGLAIAKGFVEAHGGRIWATSRPGQGSTFSFALPKAIASRN